MGILGEIIYCRVGRLGPTVQDADSFCLMPNHIHGIIVISEMDGQSRPSLPKTIQGFKSVTTRMCFKYNYKSIWQSNYYEHIIRNQEDYERIYEYIQVNPLKWKDDKYYI